MRFLALLTFLLFCVYLVFARWYFVCKVHNQCAETEDVRLKTLGLKDGETVLLQGYDQFAFDTAGVRPNLNNNNRMFLDTVAAILKANPNKNMTITAFYTEKESGIQSDFYEDLGTARAAEIRKLLMRRGIEESRISLDHGISEDLLLKEPFLVELYDPSAIPEAFEKVQFSFTNMTFSDANFAFNSDEFRPGEPFIMYADSVKTFLELNPGKALTIIGHTDNVGTEEYNYDLGIRRAESAKEYFQELGVTTDIEVESKGEKRPAASNKSSRGRQKNRRVNFVLQ